MPLLNCSEKEYRALRLPSYSVLKHARRSAEHMQHAMTTVSEPTPAMIFGNVVDCVLFDNNNVESRIAVIPEGIDRRTKEGKIAWSTFETLAHGKIMIDQKDFARALRMVDRIRQHPTAKQMLTDQRFQVPMTWVDEDTGVECKALCDSIKQGFTITDLKTTQNADWKDFSATCARFSYHVQAAMYIDGYKACTGETLPYTFIVSESTDPHSCAVYRLDNSSIDQGRRVYKHALKIYNECVKSGHFPSYPTDLQTIEIPRWAFDSIPVDGIEDPF